jgi:hypothetical protein
VRGRTCGMCGDAYVCVGEVCFSKKQLNLAETMEGTLGSQMIPNSCAGPSQILQG